MASLEDENKAALAKIIKQAGVDWNQLPKFIKDLDADIKMKKMMKDTEKKLDNTTTGKLISFTKICEDTAKFIAKQKTDKQKAYVELIGPANDVIQAPGPKTNMSAGNYVELAVILQIFLLKVHKFFLEKNKEPPQGRLKKADPGTGMDKGAMKLILGKARRSPVNCAVGLSADGRFGLLLMHISRKPRALVNDLKAQIPGAKSLRWGRVGVNKDEDARLVQIQLNKSMNSIDRRLRKTLVGTGFSKVKVVDKLPVPSGTRGQAT